MHRLTTLSRYLMNLETCFPLSNMMNVREALCFPPCNVHAVAVWHVRLDCG